MERPRFSEELSNRRRQLGFSTTQASRVLRMKEEVLIAFEEGDFYAMPKSGYAQGMLSSYARYLGLDAARIVEMYADELEEWRRDQKRRGRHPDAPGEYGQRSGGVGQPYVAARGLLPTSGGVAGDMGSFATTRVRARRSTYEDEEDYGSGDYERDTRYEPYLADRPYTNRAPSHRTRQSDAPYGRRDIQTRGVNAADYEDDLRIGSANRSYEAATTRRGRRPARDAGDRSRPRVRRQDRSRSGGRQRSSSRRNQSGGGVLQSPTQALVVVGVALVVISVILIVSISSCVNQNFNTTRTVPVSSASSTDKSAEQTSQKDGTTQNDSSATSSSSDSAKADSSSSSKDASGDKTGTSEENSTKRAAAPSVSISVADGAVTWLEIDCDGKSEIAETVTGPWQHTYTVEDLLTVQAGDTTAVSVVQDGRQVQFDSMASGIGTIRIQGAGKSSKTSTKKDETSSETSKSSTTDAPSERTATSQSTSGTSSAPMGNNAQEETSDSKSGSRNSSSKSNGSSMEDEEDEEETYDNDY